MSSAPAAFAIPTAFGLTHAHPLQHTCRASSSLTPRTPIHPRHSCTFTPSTTLTTSTPARRLAPNAAGSWTMMASEANIAKKAAKVSTVVDTLNSCLLLICAPLDGLTVAQVGQLKKRMPEGTKVITVKNTLMRRAIEDSTWKAAVSMTRFSSLWIFVKEDMKSSLGAYNSFMKEISREVPIRGGIFEGEIYDEAGVEKVSKLPTKKELIAKIAISIKGVPTKIGRSIKEVPTKLGRAVQLAFAEEGDGAESAAKDDKGDSQ